jgi:hypothetical protein
MTRSRRRLFAAAAIAAFVLGAAAALFVADGGSQEGQQSIFGLGFDPTDPQEDLLQPGHRVPLDVAVATFDWAIIRPQHQLASDKTLAEVWIGDTGAQEIGLRYESGLRAYLSVWPDSKDPGGFYRSLVSESGAGAYQEINGHPAWVVAVNEQASGYPPNAVVDLTIGRVEISLQGDFPIETLVGIAATVA